MFFMRTDSHTNLLDEVVRLGLLTCTKLEDGVWMPIGDRATLYEALINELIEAAGREHVKTVDGCYETLEVIRCVEAEDDYEREECDSCEGAGLNPDGSQCDNCDWFGDRILCDQLGGGCTCEDCTKQITDALGM